MLADRVVPVEFSGQAAVLASFHKNFRIMKKSDFRFRDRLRVRWTEIDAQQIVFNGHYLMYFDTAMAGYCAGSNQQIGWFQ